MDYTTSTFAVEVNGTSIIVFQTKWASDAERIAFGWAEQHSIRAWGSHGTELPPVIKVRVARSDEKTAAGQGTSAEFYEGVKIIYLIEPNSLSST